MSDYLKVVSGRFHGVMDLEKCYDLMQYLLDNPSDWYIYDTDEVVPEKPLSADDFKNKINEIKSIIKAEHQERYCGIVYVDDMDNPSIIKKFHPNNLGKTCGSSENPPIAKWIISKIKPQTIAKPVEKKSGFFSFLR